MPAAATQNAPRPTPKQPAQSAKQASEKKPGAYGKLYNLPQAAGIAVMALLLVAALIAGNARALSMAAPQSLLKQKTVVSIVEDRGTQAKNAVNVAQRALGEEGGAIAQANEAIERFLNADSVRELSRADQALTSAMADVAASAKNLSGEDAQMLQRALDNFAEQGSFLRQEARAYNEKAEKALSLYNRLPAKALLGEPEIYEGI